MQAGVSVGHVGCQPRGVFPHRGGFCLVQPVQLHLASLVPAPYHRLVRRVHHLFHLCQREPSDASERPMGRFPGLCVHQRGGRNQPDGLGVLGGEIERLLTSPPTNCHPERSEGSREHPRECIRDFSPLAQKLVFVAKAPLNDKNMNKQKELT